ncbi:hypothetical protein [Thermomonas aquatica]|uniref:DUF4288 domain-containing protein n=1 Tax=Thermomonas aquatica TaxID=2202149 RepID=A0A5B7ZNK2_9GAMM|nr:hypothetical protein [Thermomonas aquatica]QDA56467.1 hypothetical protein FHQ07_03645 [Thermomonas aquatica]
MSRWLAIAAYQCQIDGLPTGSIDFQVRYFNVDQPEDVELALRSEPTHEYQNHLGQTVSWPLQAIPNIQGILPIEQGSEIIGFIADRDDFERWAGGSAA